MHGVPRCYSCAARIQASQQMLSLTKQAIRVRRGRHSCYSGKFRLISTLPKRVLELREPEDDCLGNDDLEDVEDRAGLFNNDKNNQNDDEMKEKTARLLQIMADSISAAKSKPNPLPQPHSSLSSILSRTSPPSSFNFAKPTLKPLTPAEKLKRISAISNVDITRPRVRKDAALPPVKMYGSQKSVLEDINVRWRNLELIRLVDKDVQLPSIVGDSGDPLIKAFRGYEVIPDNFVKYLLEMESVLSVLKSNASEEQQTNTDIHAVIKTFPEFTQHLQQLLGAYAGLTSLSREDELNVELLHSYLRLLSDCLSIYSPTTPDGRPLASALTPATPTSTSKPTSSALSSKNKKITSQITKHILHVLTTLSLRGIEWTEFEDSLFVRIYLSSTRVRGSDVYLLTTKASKGWEGEQKKGLRELIVQMNPAMVVRALLKSKAYHWHNDDWVENSIEEQRSESSHKSINDIGIDGFKAMVNNDEILEPIYQSKKASHVLIESVEAWLSDYYSQIHIPDTDKMTLTAECMYHFLYHRMPKQALSIFTLLHEHNIAPLPSNITIPTINQSLKSLKEMSAGICSSKSNTHDQGLYRHVVYRALLETFAMRNEIDKLCKLHPLTTKDLRSDTRILAYLYPEVDSIIRFYFDALKQHGDNRIMWSMHHQNLHNNLEYFSSFRNEKALLATFYGRLLAVGANSSGAQYKMEWTKDYRELGGDPHELVLHKSKNEVMKRRRTGDFEDELAKRGRRSGSNITDTLQKMLVDGGESSKRVGRSKMLLMSNPVLRI